MSIRQEVIARAHERRILRLLPALPNRPVMRTMFISEEIDRLLFAQHPDLAMRARVGELRRDLDRFIEGSVISVPDWPYKARMAYMSRLYRPSDEVWEIRSRDPQPSLRLFGRFAEPDVFIALTWSPRKRLGGPQSLEWKDAMRHCKVVWRQLFPSYNPHSGMRICDYISPPTILLRSDGPSQRNPPRGPLLLPCVDQGSAA